MLTRLTHTESPGGVLGPGPAGVGEWGGGEFKLGVGEWPLNHETNKQEPRPSKLNFQECGSNFAAMTWN